MKRELGVNCSRETLGLSGGEGTNILQVKMWVNPQDGEDLLCPLGLWLSEKLAGPHPSKRKRRSRGKILC